MTSPKHLADRFAERAAREFDLPDQIYVGARDPIAKARAIKQCLEYLCNEAETAQLPLAAHLIGAAAEYLGEVVEKESGPGRRN